EKCSALLGGDGLRPAAATGCGSAGKPCRAVVAEIGLLRAAAGIRVVQAHGRALAFGHFLAAVVTDEHRLAGHRILLLVRSKHRGRGEFGRSITWPHVHVELHSMVAEASFSSIPKRASLWISSDG